MEILLNSLKNVHSVNVDNYEKVELIRKVGAINEYDIRNILSATEIFDAEREAYEDYRIYGKIEYMSLLNGLKSNYTQFSDFFSPQSINSKNLLNSFNFYLVRPATSGYTQIGGVTGSTTPDIMIIDEKFDNWTTSSPTNYPVGWIASVTTGSYIQQSPINRAEFVLDNQFIFSSPFNLISLRKDLLIPVYGDFIIETNVSISPLVVGTDLLTITVFSNATILYSFPTLAVSAGYKQYAFNAASSLPITHISIIANSSNKSIYLDYLKMYRPGTPSLSATTDIKFIRYFQVVATPNDFELFPAGFSNNVYGEQAYAFNFNKDFNVSGLLDNFGFPLTELFLYAQYIPSTTPIETLYGTTWSPAGIPISFSFAPATLNINDYVESTFGVKIGDLIEYSKPDFLQVQSTPQTFQIKTPCIKYTTIIIYGVPTQIPTSSYLIWKYNPFIPLRLRYFASELNSVNTNDTSYDQTTSIPYYATKLDSFGNYVWRDILPQGYTDPTTNLGVNYPFVNKKRYLFSNIILDVVPDLNDPVTLAAFAEVWYSRYATNLTKKPISDINNIGKPCL